MAVVVEQTIPFSSSSLDLHSATRWPKLFPLMRPSVRVSGGSKAQILIDTALLPLQSREVCVAAVGKTGNFSSKWLSDKHVTAFAVDKRASDSGTDDIAAAIRDAGGSLEKGLVVAMVGEMSKVEARGQRTIVMEVDGELALDHVLDLLQHAKEETRSSLANIGELLDVFAESASVTRSTFHTEKAEGNPAVLHADGAAGFEQARHAVEKDLTQVMRSHGAREESVVFSVHYSDVNGLSRLENYIIAGEIASLLGKQCFFQYTSIYDIVIGFVDKQNVKYRISSSTILDHEQAARGWAISVCPVPERFLSAQSKPSNALNDRAEDLPPAPKRRGKTTSISFANAEVRKRIEAGCAKVIEAEPAITEYDTIVGDGDCGYTLRDGARQILHFLSTKSDVSDFPDVLSELVDDLEVNMGGTSGALYCIYLSALAQGLAEEASVPDALAVALDRLLQYTQARLGDRTCLDCLIPFVRTLKETGGDAQKALEKASAGVEETKRLEAKLGRSSYLDESATRGVPDPGAYGLLVLLEGLCSS
ncbi:hypothetical protein LTR66_003289 [Elasticomyces elasticus]|nr:hypothetical protein LTR66_003289 [Elasticomyces elasticus]KAK5006393.1 hypothetical protein LTR28_006553 [Elasticomyces elasticus]